MLWVTAVRRQILALGHTVVDTLSMAAREFPNSRPELRTSGREFGTK